MTLQPGHLDPQQLLPIIRIPNTNLIDRSRREHLRESVREGNIVDALVMACVTQFGG